MRSTCIFSIIVYVLYCTNITTLFTRILTRWIMFCLFVINILFVCLFTAARAFFLSYLAAVTITGDRAANLDRYLALLAISSEDSFTCHICCDMGPRL
jgi:hypothetical protein